MWWQVAIDTMVVPVRCYLFLINPPELEVVVTVRKALLKALPCWLHTTHEYNPVSFRVTLCIERYDQWIPVSSAVLGVIENFAFSDSIIVKLPLSRSSAEFMKLSSFHFIQSNWSPAKPAPTISCLQVNLAAPFSETLTFTRFFFEILGAYMLLVPKITKWHYVYIMNDYALVGIFRNPRACRTFHESTWGAAGIPQLLQYNIFVKWPFTGCFVQFISQNYY